MSREHELFQRLTERRRALRQARNEMEDAKLQYAGKKEKHRRAMGDVEELLEEIETGRPSRPMLDAIERANGNGHETADRKPLPPDPDLMISDHLRQCEIEKGEPGDPDPDAPTRHWVIHRYDQASPGRLGPRIGTQIARTKDEALDLAIKGWPRDLVVIGESFPHGPDCGCGEGPTYHERKPAKAKARAKKGAKS